MSLPMPHHDRDLTQPELEAFVRELMSRPKDWQHLVHHDPEQRHFVLLLRDEHVAVYLICWMDDQDTGFHDHDLSSGAVGVVAGAVNEQRLLFGGTAGSIVHSGEVFTFRASDIHRVLHAGEEPAVTLHAYSPPLWRMGAYEFLETGEIRRHSQSYAEELRPLAGAA